MASWVPAYFQKRLLRAALSRLGLLDVDSLDLDSLGITIGSTSIVQLNNVGLHVQVSLDTSVLPSLHRSCPHSIGPALTPSVLPSLHRSCPHSI
jgi:hypothetical protein